MLLAIFLFAFLLRLVYILQYRSSPFFSHPIIDGETYDRMAWNLAQGKGLWKGAFWQPPLYPAFLGLIYTLLGRSPLNARLVQALLGSASCLLLYGIARRILNRPAAAAAGFIMAAYGVLIYFDGEILIPSLYIFLLLAGLLLLLRAGDGGGAIRWGEAGIVLGLASLARPNILLFIPLAALWAGIRAEGEKGLRRLAPALFLLLGAFVSVAPVTLRNLIVSKDFVLISSNGGLNFYLGNNPAAEETVAIRPGFHWDRLVDEPFCEEGVSAPSARSRYFFRKAFTFIRGNPLSFLSLLGEKFARFWNSFEMGRNQDVYASRKDSSLLALLLWRVGPFGFPFGLLAPLACAGFFTSWALRNRLLPLTLFLLATCLSVVLFFPASRYRLPVVPVLILFAVHFLFWGIRQAREKRGRTLLLSLVPFILVLFAVNRGFPAFDRIYRSERDRYLGTVYGREGNRKEAESAYRRALDADPGYAEVHAELGQILLEENRVEEALVHLERAAALCPFSPKTHILLGGALARAGKSDEAEARYREAIRIAPFFAPGRRDLGILLVDEHRLEEAEAELEEALRLDPEDLDAHYKLGHCAFLQGKYWKAEAALLGALRLAPGDEEILQKLRSLRMLRMKEGE